MNYQNDKTDWVPGNGNENDYWCYFNTIPDFTSHRWQAKNNKNLTEATRKKQEKIDELSDIIDKTKSQRNTYDKSKHIIKTTKRMKRNLDLYKEVEREAKENFIRDTKAVTETTDRFLAAVEDYTVYILKNDQGLITFTDLLSLEATKVISVDSTNNIDDKIESFRKVHENVDNNMNILAASNPSYISKNKLINDTIKELKKAIKTMSNSEKSFNKSTYEVATTAATIESELTPSAEYARDNKFAEAYIQDSIKTCEHGYCFTSPSDVSPNTSEQRKVQDNNVIILLNTLINQEIRVNNNTIFENFQSDINSVGNQFLYQKYIINS